MTEFFVSNIYLVFYSSKIPINQRKMEVLSAPLGEQWETLKAKPKCRKWKLISVP